MKCTALLLVLGLFSANLPAAESNAGKPYKLVIWADVMYDTSGRPVQVSFPDKDKYPAKFIQNLQIKLSQSKIDPPVENGLPATFETGVRIDLTITPADTGGSVKIDGMYEQPRITKKAMDKYPPELLQSQWTGVVKVKCTVGSEGKCSKLELLDPANIPEPARKFALGSMKAWRFKPQKVNGKTVPYELIVPFGLRFEDPYPSDFIGRY